MPPPADRVVPTPGTASGGPAPGLPPAVVGRQDLRRAVPNGALYTLAVCAFGIGSTEFAPMGLLPVLARGVEVSIPTAGTLISAYASGVLVGAPVMTLALARLDRGAALVVLMAIFTLGNLLSALAPGFGTLMAARVVMSLSHGAFFGLCALVAAELAPEGKRAGALATMFSGLTIANIGGVPAATWVGQHLGWRVAFSGIAGFGLCAMAALLLCLPRCQAGGATEVRRELQVSRRAAVLLALSTTVLGASAMFTLYTYIAPILETVTHATSLLVAAMLSLIGVGFTVGNAVGGRLSDRSDSETLLGGFVAVVAVMLVFPFAAKSTGAAALALLVWSAAAFALVPPIQLRVMRAAADAPGLASSVDIGAFNLGNALRAAIGGAVIATGAGYADVSVAGAALAAAGLGLVWASGRIGAEAPG